MRNKDCLDIWKGLTWSLDDSNLALACITTWAIWGDRNKVCNMDSIPSVQHRCDWIMDYVVEVGVKPIDQCSSIIDSMVYDISNCELSILHVDATCRT